MAARAHATLASAATRASTIGASVGRPIVCHRELPMTFGVVVRVGGWGGMVCQMARMTMLLSGKQVR